MKPFSPEILLKTLVDHQVEFVLIGGVAAVAHGLARATFDLDVVYNHTVLNCKNIASALGSFNPYLRDVPEGLPFQLNSETLIMGCNFTLTTSVGDLDIMAQVPGMTSYEELLAASRELVIYGNRINCVGLEKLIQLKRASGRAKDLEMLAQLEALRDNVN